jgi:tRNA pseudouridine55 synthase
MGRRRRGRKIDGWIAFDKPGGVTSTSALAQVRRLFDAAKAGHAGTLDPLATGLLPVALGEATKLCAEVMESGKSYLFTLRWGEERDTDDAEGQVTAASERRPSREDILSALAGFLGEIEQTPPDYSAIKVDGARAYDLAREGRPARLAPRVVRVDRLELLAQADPDHAEFELECGRGTYVRSIARDLGRKLGALAYVSALRRTRVGPFCEANAFSLAQLEELGHKGALETALLPVETALADIPALAVTGPEAFRLKCGQAIRVPSTMEGAVYAISAGRPVALARLEGGELRPVRVFNL